MASVYRSHHNARQSLAPSEAQVKAGSYVHLQQPACFDLLCYDRFSFSAFLSIFDLYHRGPTELRASLQYL